MRKLFIALTLTTAALAASAERVKAAFTVVDDWGSPVTNASLKILTPKMPLRFRGISRFHIATVSRSYSYSYKFDDIGNRVWSCEDTNHVEYAVNNLNQYTQISSYDSLSHLGDAFIPDFDMDGNQTLVKTSTGVWSVKYDAENRPVCWSNGVTNIVMAFDCKGRRVVNIEASSLATNSNQKYIYDKYVCIARRNSAKGEASTIDRFIWDPTELIATKPLVYRENDDFERYYIYDANKNVSYIIVVLASEAMYAAAAMLAGVSVAIVATNPELQDSLGSLLNEMADKVSATASAVASKADDMIRQYESMCNELNDVVQKTKSTVGAFHPAACRCSMSCYELKARRSAWLAEGVARAQRDVLCWGGGDFGHQIRQADVWRNVGTCSAIALFNGCD